MAIVKDVPSRKGSVLDWCITTEIEAGVSMLGMKEMSLTAMVGREVPGEEVNSLTRKKPKNAKVNEAHSMTVSRSSEITGFKTLRI